MTDELDPQTQQHIDDSADVAADTDAATCNDTDVDDATLDNGAATEIPTAEDAGEQNDDSAAQDDAPEKDAAPAGTEVRRQARPQSGGYPGHGPPLIGGVGQQQAQQ